MTQTRTCPVENCESLQKVKGLCAMHYARWVHHGTTDKPIRSRHTWAATLADRVWADTIAAPKGCVLYVGYARTDGYSTMRHAGAERRRHCLAYELHYGEYDRQKLQINHTCDNRNCVNPYHLYAGSQQENMADKRTRARSAKGRMVNTNVLSESQVLEVFNSSGPAAAVAREFGVHESTVCKIRKGQTWAWLTGVSR